MIAVSCRKDKSLITKWFEGGLVFIPALPLSHSSLPLPLPADIVLKVIRESTEHYRRVRRFCLAWSLLLYSAVGLP
jgi:hypothetical protein